MPAAVRGSAQPPDADHELRRSKLRAALVPKHDEVANEVAGVLGLTPGGDVEVDGDEVVRLQAGYSPASARVQPKGSTTCSSVPGWIRAGGFASSTRLRTVRT